MKTITLYELLGLVKDGKAPKKILIKDKVYYLLVDEGHYVYSHSKDISQWDWFIDRKINISQNLDLEVTILDENYLENKPLEEKKIPEKLETYKDGNNDIFLDDLCYKYMPIHKDSLSFNEQVIVDKLNEVLDYLKSKGE